MKVAVLMSTYNGEQFIIEQLDTIKDQKEVECFLFIRDDGSSDNTLSIIKEYKEKHPNFYIEIITGKNLGVARSFMYLLDYAYEKMDFDYFAFADQDDYWFKDKLSCAIQSLRGNDCRPGLYMSQFQMADVLLKKIDTPSLNPKLKLENALANNIATGCTMVFNKYLVKELTKYTPRFITMHDYWIYLVAVSINAYIYYDTTSHFLYRQHSNNVIGGKGDNFVKRWRLRWNKLFKEGNHFVSKMCTEIIEGYATDIPPHNYKLLMRVSRVKNIWNRFYLLFNMKIFGTTLDKTIRCKLLILTGKY